MIVKNPVFGSDEKTVETIKLINKPTKKSNISFGILG